MEKALSVREDIVVGLEVSDEFLELLDDGVVGGGGCRFAANVVPGVGLVAVVDASFVPP